MDKGHDGEPLHRFVRKMLNCVTEDTRIILTRIPPGSSIGRHTQSTGDDVNYVLEGCDRAVCNGKEALSRERAMYV